MKESRGDRTHGKERLTAAEKAFHAKVVSKYSSQRDWHRNLIRLSGKIRQLLKGIGPITLAYELLYRLASTAAVPASPVGASSAT